MSLFYFSLNCFLTLTKNWIEWVNRVREALCLCDGICYLECSNPETYLLKNVHFSKTISFRKKKHKNTNVHKTTPVSAKKAQAIFYNDFDPWDELEIEVRTE